MKETLARVDDQFDAGAIDEAIRSHGFFRTDGINFGQDAHQFALDLAQKLGTAVQQFGKDVLELVPREDAKPNGPFGFGAFPIHTDGIFKEDHLCPDLIIMLCIRPSKGGEHLLADSKKVIDGMGAKSAINIDRLLSTNLVFCHQGEVHNGHDSSIVLPVAPPQEQAVNLYSGPVYNQAESRLRYSTTLMKRIGGDFTRVSEAMDSNVFPVENIQEGTVWITDNKRMLHGREEILSPERKMLRVHVKRSGLHKT